MEKFILNYSYVLVLLSKYFYHHISNIRDLIVKGYIRFIWPVPIILNNIIQSSYLYQSEFLDFLQVQ